MLSRNLLALAASFTIGCINYPSQSPQEQVQVKPQPKTLDYYVANTLVAAAASRANENGNPIHFLTEESPPEISGNYTLKFNDARVPITIQTNPDHTLTLSNLDQNTKSLGAFVRGKENALTIYSPWQVSFSALDSNCKLESALIFYGSKDKSGNLYANYLSVPLDVMPGSDCSNIRGSSGKAYFEKR